MDTSRIMDKSSIMDTARTMVIKDHGHSKDYGHQGSWKNYGNNNKDNDKEDAQHPRVRQMKQASPPDLQNVFLCLKKTRTLLTLYES